MSIQAFKEAVSLAGTTLHNNLLAGFDGHRHAGNAGIAATGIEGLMGINNAKLKVSALGETQRYVQALVAAFDEIAPEFTVQPMGVTVTAPDPINLSATVVGAESLQWLKDGEFVLAATTDTLVIDPSSVGDSGAYQLRAFGPGGVITDSAVAVVTVNP